MEQKEKTAREMQAEEQVRQAKARLNQIRREERAKTRKEQDHQKFILGGIVVKYFPEAYGFSEQEMCRILACAFKNRDIQNMIATVIKDRKTEGAVALISVAAFPYAKPQGIHLEMLVFVCGVIF